MIIDIFRNHSSDKASEIEEVENYIDQIEMVKTQMRVAAVKCKSTNKASSVKVKIFTAFFVFWSNLKIWDIHKGL